MRKKKEKPELMSSIHPDASCWQIELLNERSENLIIAREWEDQFFITLRTKFSQWIEPEPGQQKIFVKDCVVDVWTFDTVGQVDDMINMLKKIRDEIYDYPLGEGDAKPKP